MWWQHLLRQLDDGVMATASRIAGQQGFLIVLMFHGLFTSEEEAFAGDIDPYQPLTEQDLAALIEYFQANGYQFISPADLGRDIAPSSRRVLLTFDDGYANNLRALPILKRYDVPATFFIAAGNVASGEPFWWDVLYRERVRRNTGRAQIVDERQRLKSFNNREIKAQLRSMFGADAFTAQSDADRPMTVAEVQTAARDPLVTIGNHTVDHELLTRVPLDDARRQIFDCQAMLSDWTNEAPRIIAYPNGIYDDSIVKLAAEAGLTAAVTSMRGKVRLPLTANQRMRLPRYAMIGGPSLLRHCRVVMAPFSLSGIKHAIHSRRQQAALP